jgi:hypothetical protein
MYIAMGNPVHKALKRADKSANAGNDAGKIHDDGVIALLKALHNDIEGGHRLNHKLKGFALDVGSGLGSLLATLHILFEGAVGLEYNYGSVDQSRAALEAAFGRHQLEPPPVVLGNIYNVSQVVDVSVVFTYFDTMDDKIKLFTHVLDVRWTNIFGLESVISCAY